MNLMAEPQVGIKHWATTWDQEEQEQWDITGLALEGLLVPPHLDMCDRDWAHLHQVTTVQMHSFPCSLLPTASDPAGSGAALTAGSRCSTWWQGNSNCPLPCFESHNPILCLIIPRDSTPHSFLTLFTGTHWQSPVVLDGAQLIYIRICPILPYNLFHWFFKSPIWNLYRPQNVCKVTG